jgi:hypothetical protein
LRDGILGHLVDPESSNSLEAAIVATLEGKARVLGTAASVFDRPQFVDRALKIFTKFACGRIGR